MAEIHLIAAQTRNRVIGRDGQMPWHLPADLAHFKQTTLNHPIIMGRKTYQSIGHALPNRRNCIISRHFQADDAEVYASLEAALIALKNEQKIFVIGGGVLYQAAMSLADILDITWIETELLGDTYFPEIASQTWQEVARKTHPADEKNRYALTFTTYQRKYDK